MHFALKIVLVVVIAVPVVVVLGLGLARLRPGRGLHRAEIVIDAPASAVWRHLTDPALVKAWVGGLVELEPLNAGAASEPFVGARDRMVVAVGEQRTTMYSEITAVELGRRIDQRVRADEGLSFTEDMSFALHQEEGGGRTRFVVATKSDYTSFIGKLLEPIISVVAGKKLDDDLVRLKTNVERDVAAAVVPRSTP